VRKRATRLSPSKSRPQTEEVTDQARVVGEVSAKRSDHALIVLPEGAGLAGTALGAAGRIVELAEV
jgi:hypothetical protein